MPYLVMDTGYGIAPYNHAELGQPLAIDYVWAARSASSPSTRDVDINNCSGSMLAA